MNKQAAREWLTKSWHNLSMGQLLYNANHYTDIIAVELHYSCEKILKSFLAYENKRIPKKLKELKISKDIVLYIDLSNDLELLKQISKYHIEETYPTFDRTLPPREEIKEVLEFAEKLFDKVCSVLEIEKRELL